jgi:hypothetical protein
MGHKTIEIDRRDFGVALSRGFSSQCSAVLRVRPIYLSGRLRLVGGLCGNKIRLSNRIAPKVINTPIMSRRPSIIVAS